MSAYPNAADPATATGPNPYTQAPYTQSAPPFPAGAIQTSPGLAFALGLIPGVGAIYNGQYLKGLVHAVIFGLLIAMMNSASSGAQVAIVMGFCAFVFYMPFEAYHTARKRQMGLQVDEFSSIVPQGRYSSRVPIGPVALIGLGVLFLLDTLHLVNFRELSRYWPVLLIFVGAYMLYSRAKGPVAVRPPLAAPFAPSETYAPERSAGTDLMGTRNE